MQSTILTLRRFILTSALSFLLASPALGAQTIRGFLGNADDGCLRLLVRESRDSLKVEASASLTKTLSKMRDGNFIVGSGDINLEAKTVRIDTVHTVGLQELLGTWQSSRWEIFEFQDFSKLNLYLQTAQSDGTPSRTQTHSLTYVVSPEKDDVFSIFISDDRVRLMAGKLRLTDKLLTLSVIDEKTGQVAEKISLSPVSLK